MCDCICFCVRVYRDNVNESFIETRSCAPFHTQTYMPCSHIFDLRICRSVWNTLWHFVLLFFIDMWCGFTSFIFQSHVELFTIFCWWLQLKEKNVRSTHTLTWLEHKSRYKKRTSITTHIYKQIFHEILFDGIKRLCFIWMVVVMLIMYSNVVWYIVCKKTDKKVSEPICRKFLFFSSILPLFSQFSACDVIK